MSLVYRGLRTLHYMNLPSAARRLKGNFSAVTAFDFSIDIVANTVFGSHETKKLIGTLFHVLMEINSRYKNILS